MPNGYEDVPLRPEFNLEFHIDKQDFPKLFNIIKTYGAAKGFSFQDAGAAMPPMDGRRVFFLNLYRDDYTQVILDNMVRKDFIIFAAYKDKRSQDFEAVVTPLIAELRREWPDIHKYTGS